MTPNLISHHLNKLRAVGLVNIERDSSDARWMYFSINHETLNELRTILATFLDPSRIKPRRPNCGPHSKSPIRPSKYLKQAISNDAVSDTLQSLPPEEQAL